MDRVSSDLPRTKGIFGYVRLDRGEVIMCTVIGGTSHIPLQSVRAVALTTSNAGCGRLIISAAPGLVRCVAFLPWQKAAFVTIARRLTRALDVTEGRSRIPLVVVPRGCDLPGDGSTPSWPRGWCTGVAHGLDGLPAFWRGRRAPMLVIRTSRDPAAEVLL